MQRRLTDSVAPVAIPCKMRHAICSWNDRLVAAPIVLPTSRKQQPMKIGRRPKTMHKGKIMKAPTPKSAHPSITILHRSPLTQRHDQTRIGRQLYNLLSRVSITRILLDEEGQYRTRASNKNQREDGVPAASDDDP
jgi:hypothetical protein